MIPPLNKIISGGQTGADRAALDVAIWYGFPHGGWCPKGRIAEDGLLGSQYQLKETPSSSYPQRTEWNVRDSDGSIIFTFKEQMSRGCLLTVKSALKHNKPFLHIFRSGHFRPEAAIQRFIEENKVRVLNVAGSRESGSPGIHEWVKKVLTDALFWSHSQPHSLGGPGEG